MTKLVHHTNTRAQVCRGAAACLTASILGLVLNLQASPPQMTLPSSATNAPTAEVAIPKSEFDDKLPQGKDPFFPHSTRRGAVAASAKKDVFDSSALALKGFSGPVNRRLAIINDRTFETGEEGEVTTPTGRMQVRCEEIKEASVVVSFGDPPRRVELRLPRAF